jgi:selenocysteine lyase/cysteine desulfurase
MKAPSNNSGTDLNVLGELEKRAYQVLETYSNVHRGSGPFSEITTNYYEQARTNVLDYLGLKAGRHRVIFCSPTYADKLTATLKLRSFFSLSGERLGLALGIRALVVRKRNLPQGPPYFSGGGTAKLISREWVIWASVPEKFEAGTPAIVNVIMFAEALKLVQTHGEHRFREAILKKTEVPDPLESDDLNDLRGKKLLQKLRSTYIINDKQIPSLHGTTSGINLDNSASTPTFAPIWEAFRRSIRLKGPRKKELVEEVRTICSGFLNASMDTYELLFCANTTEAINLAAENLKHQLGNEQPVILSTLLEHSSNDLPWRSIPGCQVIRMGVDTNGMLDLDELGGLLKEYNELKLHGRKRIQLMALAGASNVMGVCSNLEGISCVVHQYGAKILVDAAQLVAHRRIDVWGSNIDYLAFSGHKIYAPFGSGLLVVKKELLCFHAEELAGIKSSGEENLGGIAALGKALSLLDRIGMNLIEEEERLLTARLLKGMATIPGIRIFGPNDPLQEEFNTKIGVIAFNLKDVLSFKVAKELARRRGIGIRAGCHCAHLTVKHILNVSPGLERFQRVMQTMFPRIKFPGVARVSLGLENTPEDVDVFIQTLKAISSR